MRRVGHLSASPVCARFGRLPKNAAVGRWMQSQIEVLLTQMAMAMSEPTQSKRPLSARLRGIGHAPQGFDYKQELADRY